VNVEFRGERSTSSELVGESSILLGFREPKLGESSPGAVMDTLVPIYRETMSSTPIPTYQGRSEVRRIGPIGDSSSIEWNGEGSGKEFPWSRGLGFKISPIKTRSARKKAESISPTPILHFNNFSDNGVLRGMKALAREKS
jgi:hypothetical protein